MSDNVCPDCKAERDAAGIIWHAVGCPEKPEYYYQCTSIDVIDKSEYDKAQAEIARLKDALEKAERDRQMAVDMRDTAWICYRNAQKERDEARKWAKYWYRAYNEDV